MNEIDKTSLENQIMALLVAEKAKRAGLETEISRLAALLAMAREIVGVPQPVGKGTVTTAPTGTPPNKSQFIRERGHMTPKEIIGAAAEVGMTLTPAFIAAIRGAVRKAARAGAGEALAPKAKPPTLITLVTQALEEGEAATTDILAHVLKNPVWKAKPLTLVQGSIANVLSSNKELFRRVDKGRYTLTGSTTTTVTKPSGRDEPEPLVATVDVPAEMRAVGLGNGVAALKSNPFS